MNQKKLTAAIVRTSAALALALSVVTSIAGSKPTIYSSLQPDQENALRSIQAALNDRFNVALAPEREQFSPARVTKRMVHPYIREVGRVTIAAVADVDGRLRDPVVIESTNPRLNIMMRDSVKKWSCEPARLNGAPVASVTQSTIEVRWRKPILIY